MTPFAGFSPHCLSQTISSHFRNPALNLRTHTHTHAPHTRRGRARARANRRTGKREAEEKKERRWAVRPTQPSEPILLPKVRIQVADFPYPHSSKPLEAANLGDLMRIWVRSGAECIVDDEADLLRAARDFAPHAQAEPARNNASPKLRIVMLVSDFQGPAVEPRTPLELRCFAV